jgi:hypothetical protein
VGQGEWGSESKGKGASGSGGVGQWVVGKSGTVGRRRKWDSGPKGAAQVTGREARRRSRGRETCRWSRGATRFAKGS